MRTAGDAADRARTNGPPSADVRVEPAPSVDHEHVHTTEELGHLDRRSAARHYPALEGLRAVAALAVVAYHLHVTLAPKSPRSGAVRDFVLGLGTGGVAIFFVLSGFLLWRPFSLGLQGAVRRLPAVRVYLGRRAARIFPAYWLAFAVSAIAIGLPGVRWSNTAIYALLGQDYAGTTRYQGIGPAWSLSVEATFYIVLPLIALLCLRTPRRFVPLVFPALWLIPVALNVVHPAAPETILTHMDWFAWGLVLAHVSCSTWAKKVDAGLARTGTTMALLLLGCMAYAAAVTTGGTARELWFGLFAAALVAVGAGVTGRPWPRRALAAAPLAWLGLISYGIYLWHVPIIILALQWSVSGVGLVLLVVPLTVSAAAVSFYLVERPVLRWARREQRRSQSETERRDHEQ